MNRRKKPILFFLSLTMLFGSFVYSCSSDDFDFFNDTSKEDAIDEQENIGCRLELVKSIIASEEYLDFIISCDLFSDKVDRYMSTLSRNEREELLKNANNDDYLQNLSQRIDIKKEIKFISETRGRLFSNTAFLQLNDFEKIKLFDEYPVKNGFAIIKTRNEGGSKDECENARQKAYSIAYNNFTRRLSLCDYLPTDDKYACQMGAKLNYEAEKEQANTEYNQCIKGL